jgi:hypothetical protein
LEGGKDPPPPDIVCGSYSNGMFIEMGNAETFTAHYLRMGAYSGGTYIESNSNRSIIFRIWSGVVTLGHYERGISI